MLSDIGRNTLSLNLVKGLNPCSNGICSLTVPIATYVETLNGLNPCSNGICSLIKIQLIETEARAEVLILVLMEYAL